MPSSAAISVVDTLGAPKRLNSASVVSRMRSAVLRGAFFAIGPPWLQHAAATRRRPLGVSRCRGLVVDQCRDDPADGLPLEGAAVLGVPQEHGAAAAAGPQATPVVGERARCDRPD